MFTTCAIVVVLGVIFYKWFVANYDYFEKRGIPYLKPKFLFGSNMNLLINKKSLPEFVKNLYYALPDEK